MGSGDGPEARLAAVCQDTRVLASALALVSSLLQAAEPARVLIVVGPSNHPPGTHEVAAGGRVMKHFLENMSNLPGVKAEVVEGWPAKDLRAAASTVVFIGDQFPPNRLPDAKRNLAELDEMMKRGCGIVCVHYATGLTAGDVAEDGEHPLLHWMGGYFATRCQHHQSVAKVFQAATISPAAEHPINRGWKEFTLHDEPYINNYFGKDGNRPAPNVTVLATSLLPPEAPKRETVAWCVERPDGGRGFGIVMPHFYQHWTHEDLRRFILNGIVWTAKLDVPADGVKTASPDLAAFKPVSPTPEPTPKKAQPAATKASPATADVSRADLLDRIHGGWAGMLIGGLEGLPHEFKYKEQPRDTLPDFTFLEKGARSDDDNDFEWPHLYFMDKEGTLKLPYPRIVEIWKANMNSGIWVANKKARALMDQGVVPPETGSVARNPAAWYNLSGQFCVESYGLIAPGMPQSAAEIGLHYTRIAVSEEPLQAAQFWSSLIALRAFHAGPIAEAMQRALAAVDPKSAMAEVVADTRKAFQAHPDDWKAARQEIDAKWRVQRQWNDNSTPVNGAGVCLALLYGRDDFYRTLQYAMALGYDADCNAATAGATVGVRLGFKRIAALPQFKMPDHYANKTRPQLPAECKVSEQAETLLRVTDRVIRQVSPSARI